MKHYHQVLSFDWRTLLSGILFVLAFPPFNLTPLAFIALIPWFFALERAPHWKHALAQGVWLSLWVSLGGFYWIAYSLSQYGRLPWVLSLLGLFLFAVVGQLQLYLYAPIRHLILRKFSDDAFSLFLPMGLAFLYVAVEWMIPKLFEDTLGYSFHAAERLKQIADIGGPLLITFLLIFTQESAFKIYQKLRTRGEPSLQPALRSMGVHFFFLFAIWTLVATYGHFRLEQIRSLIATPEKTFTAAMIQANIGDFDKVAAVEGSGNAARAILDRFFSLSDHALTLSPHIDAIIWPETAYPSTFRSPETTAHLARDQRMERFVRTRNTPVFFGGYDHQNKKDYNSFFFLLPQADLENKGPFQDLYTYHKHILLLFGEYIPGYDRFSFIQRAFPQVGNFGKGVGPEVLDIGFSQEQRSNAGNGAGLGKRIRIAPTICYEGLFPWFSAQAARNKAEVFINITNDSWFGPTSEPALHLTLTSFRAIETRRSMIRSTNTGISALILPDGSIVDQTPTFQERVQIVEAPIIAFPMTLMTLLGDWFGRFALAMTFLLGAFGWRRNRQLSNK
jgi:apolipoprotein N-acyltransferase